MMTNRRLPLTVLVLSISFGAVYAEERIVDAPKPLELTTVDPESGEPQKFVPGPAAGEEPLVPGCQQIGDYIDVFPTQGQTGINRYRANVYEIEADAELREIKMELAFTGNTDLYVSVHRREADGSYLRVEGGDIRLLNQAGLGNNSPKFYATGVLDEPILLEAGRIYAIGFAWGNKTVYFGRDQLAYPQPFAVGDTLGLVVLNSITPPIDNLIPSGQLPVFTNGALSMQLCFVPEPGACCIASTANCQALLKDDCDAAGGYFFGERTTCAEHPCEFGACCNECGECADFVPKESCTGSGGTHWRGVDCPSPASALCPATTGACCREGFPCSVVCESQCTGAYKGDGTTCDPDPCAGACCLPSLSQCTEMTQLSCTGFGGTYKGGPAGGGTTCDTVPPSLECGGACCFGTNATTGALTSCSPVAQRSLCRYNQFPVTAYRGDATSCPDESGTCGNISDYRSCCLPDGLCLNTPSAAVCQAMGGEFNASIRCEGLSNGCPMQACCLPDGVCQPRTVHGCGLLGGNSVVGQTTCGANTCRTGACCSSNLGICEVVTQAACTDAVGNYRGNGTNCINPTTTCPGLGACCRTDGACFQDFTLSHCDDIDGDFQGVTSECTSPAVDCDERGACCAVTGTCLFVVASSCAEIGGAFGGIGSQCPAGVAPCPSGACCFGDSCAIMTPAGCGGAGGEFAGLDTSCDAADCATGSCCADDGSCSETLAFECAADRRFSAGGVCTPNTCVPIGACCLPAGGCERMTQAGCESDVQGVYQGNATTCEGALCVTGACCHVDGACETRLPEFCVAPTDQFSAGLGCSAIQCVARIGACCHGDTSCEDDVLVDDCNATGDTMNIGEDCDSVTCIGLGACCDAGQCSFGSQASCETPGEYQGDGTTCEPNPCGPPCVQSILSSNPAHCAIDARQTHTQATGESTKEWDAVTLTMACDTAGLSTSDFSVSQTLAGTPPNISTVAPNGLTVRVGLDRAITAGSWTCVIHVASDTRVCLGYLPGDLNGDRTAAPADILDLIDNLNGVFSPSLPPYGCDADRSGVCNPADILTAIDLLNGAGDFEIWNGRNLPVCPSASVVP